MRAGQKLHVLICCDEERHECCAGEKSRESWLYLKRRLKELGLSMPEGEVRRGRTFCLGVCCEGERSCGPIMVIHPENVWYSRCTPDVIERILIEHLIGGIPVESNIIPAGVAGHPADPHYADQLPLFLAGEAIRVPWTREAVERATVSTLALVPAAAR